MTEDYRIEEITPNNRKRIIKKYPSFKSNNKSKESGDECQFSLLVEALSLDKSCIVVNKRKLTSEWSNKEQPLAINKETLNAGEFDEPNAYGLVRFSTNRSRKKMVQAQNYQEPEEELSAQDDILEEDEDLDPSLRGLMNKSNE